ncbi:MAG: alpha-E domain-containing protein [Gemmatimonadaceae bacterium]|nr:alpha-E domain-containing protein [Gemmatimonadaceae bacterium]
MISRVADSCFWFGRYLERTEATARLLYVTRNLAMDAELEAKQCWLPVVIVSGEEPRFMARLGPQLSNERVGDVVEFYMSWDENNLSSIRSSVEAARENARSIREVISLEVWEAINEMYLWLGSEVARDEYHSARYSFYKRLRQGCQLISGLLRSTMLHELPLNFIWLGMLLERGSQTARVVDVHHHALVLHERTHQVIETALWLSLLRVCSAYEPFTKKNRGRATGDAVAAFLLFEGLFPKSIAYCIREARSRFAVIRPPDRTDLPGGLTQARLQALDRWMRERAEDVSLGDIHELLTHVVDEVAAICTGLSREVLGQAFVASAMESAQ